VPSSPAGTAAHPLSRVLRPRSVAVVGASGDPTKRGHLVVRGLLERGYRGRILPVNPRGGELLGLPMVREIEGLPEGVDLAVVCTPAETAPEVVEALGRRGVAGAVVLAVGFRESGDVGSDLEDRLARAARSSGVRVIGPNTSGMMNLSIGLDLLGLPEVPRGRIALVAQSGNIALDLFTEASAAGGEGFSLYVGMGNQADVAAHEVLDYLAHDRDTDVIVIHAEGFADGRAFVEAARRVGRRKPILVLNGGRTAAGEGSARSHTGAVASGQGVVRSALRQAGVVEARRGDELLVVAEALVRQPRPRGGVGFALLSDGGGQATLAADALSEAGVPLAPLAEATRAALRTLLGRAAAVGNPVDVAGAGDRDPSVFPRALRILLDDPGVSGVLVIGLFGGYAIRFSRQLADAEEAGAREIAFLARATGKPVLLHSIYARAHSGALEELRGGGIPVIRSLEAACSAVSALWGRRLGGGGGGGRGAGDAVLLGARSTAGLEEQAPGWEGVRAARAEGRTSLLETEVRAILEGMAVPLVPARFCRTEAEAAEAGGAVEGPLAVRLVSGTFLHKSEVGGVVLGVQGRSGAARAFRRIVRSARRAGEERAVDPGVVGVLVSPLLPAPVAELLVGVRRDPAFGPILTVGAGGTLVEILVDVSTRILPVHDREVAAMLGELRIAPRLGGYRGGPGVARGALVRFIQGVAAAALRHPDIVEMELNPVFAYPRAVVGVDARAYLEPAERATSGAES
jgi:acetate---CoA ligase (ADP-forming)